VPTDVLVRRRKQTPSPENCNHCTRDEFGNCSFKHEEEEYGDTKYPSWSWCGWMGGKVEYQSDMVGGCLLNVQQWLKMYTWIQWHIRDHEGNLRPLWDRQVFRQDLSDESCWKGYIGRAREDFETPTPHDHRKRDSGYQSSEIEILPNGMRATLAVTRGSEHQTKLTLTDLTLQICRTAPPSPRRPGI
jgi:hypothetical protein